MEVKGWLKLYSRGASSGVEIWASHPALELRRVGRKGNLLTIG
jgi:hypothetical protein